MKIAIVHDWLVTYAGAERVLEQILHCYPEADLFSVLDLLPQNQKKFLQGKIPVTTWIQRLPLLKKYYRNYLPFMPKAMKGLNLKDYDLILSSSHAVAKGVSKRRDQLHISYVHSPMRYAWDLQEQYLEESGLGKGAKGALVRAMLARLRQWDKKSADGVDHLIANSAYIAKRILNCYQRESTVVYPPVDVDAFEFNENKEDYYVTVSRMVPYKKIDLIVEAFAGMPDKKLKVIGDGPDREKILKKTQSNIEFLGAVDFPQLKTVVAKAKGFVFAAEEDFGISIVEAQACGTPVIAYGRGGALETVRGLDQERPTGVFFEKQESSFLQAAIRTFEQKLEEISPQDCRENAKKFSIEQFRSTYKCFVNDRLAQRRNSPALSHAR